MQRASTYVRELHAITTAVSKWRQYLLGHPFVILTDHKILKELVSQVIQTPEQQVYLSKLLGYDYNIQYKSGKSNLVADALSRLPVAATYYVLSILNFSFLEQLQHSLHNSSDFTALKTAILADPSSHSDYSIHGDLIMYKGRIWMDSSNPSKQLLLEEFHKTSLGGHMGVAKTLHHLQANFWWHDMRIDVKQFVSQCSVCQQIKYETKKPAGLLQPLPSPTSIWEDLSLDFITSLPSSHGYTVILVVVDRLSKGAHFGALPTAVTAFKVATLFLDMVCKLHGFPRSFVSDRDSIFISKFW